MLHVSPSVGKLHIVILKWECFNNNIYILCVKLTKDTPTTDCLLTEVTTKTDQRTKNGNHTSQEKKCNRQKSILSINSRKFVIKWSKS